MLPWQLIEMFKLKYQNDLKLKKKKKPNRTNKQTNKNP